MLIVGVVYVAPVPNEVPPVDTLYQFIVPAEAVAPKVTIPESHIDVSEVEVIEGEL